MAEILLSLTIIGVVAAITLPSLTGNINERTWNTQRKALYARISQAISLMPSVNGYGTLTEDENHSVTADTAAETFITEGLAKVLKINNICDVDHLQDCGIPPALTTITGSSLDLPKKLSQLNASLVYVNLGSDLLSSYHSIIDTKAAAFETQNGESIAVYYNPTCMPLQDNPWGWAQAEMCANFIYDLNGTKGPNTVGKDIGVISIMGGVDPMVVAPNPMNRDAGNAAHNNASNKCTTMDSEYRMPNRRELASVWINRALFQLTPATEYWSSDWYYGPTSSQPKAWGIDSAGRQFYNLQTFSYRIRCVKR